MSKLLYCPIAKLLFSVTGLPYGCIAKLPFLTVICGFRPMPRPKNKFCNERTNVPFSMKDQYRKKRVFPFSHQLVSETTYPFPLVMPLKGASQHSQQRPGPFLSQRPGADPLLPHLFKNPEPILLKQRPYIIKGARYLFGRARGLRISSLHTNVPVYLLSKGRETD